MLRLFVVLFCLLGMLVGCSPLEHRSEAVAKAPLPTLPSEGQVVPRVLWTNSRSAGVGKSNTQLSVAVNAGTVFIVDHKGRLFALDKKTGAMQWEVQGPQDAMSGPGLAKDRLFVGTEKGEVYTYRTTGEFVWKADVATPVLAAPCSNGKQVFVHTLGGGLVALDLSSGDKRWQYDVNVPPLILRHSSRPAFYQEDVIAGFSNGKLMAFNQLNGNPQWEKELGSFKGRSELQRMIDISADPIVANGVVYVVGYQGHVAALNATTGETIWEKPLSSFVGMTLANNKLFVTDDSGVLWALDAQTGKTLWHTDGLQGRLPTAPLAVGSYLVLGDSEGYLHWVTQNKGQFVGRLQLDSKGVQMRPVLSQDVIYALGQGGKVAAVLTPVNR